ncbi:hypothetical protein ACUR5C_09115 [Aliikangiella sp. IMCC44653]
MNSNFDYSDKAAMNEYLHLESKAFSISRLNLAGLKPFFYAILIISCLGASLANAKLYVHQLKNVASQQIIPVIQPHISAQAKISGKDYTLFIEASEVEITKIKSMLESLDRAPLNYLIEVKISQRKLTDWERKHAKVKITAQGSSLNSKSYSTQQQSQNNRHFKVRATEGYSAFINTGESFPQTHIVKEYDAFIPQTSHRKVSSGFYVTVQQTGPKTVRLAVSAQNQTRSQANSGVQSSATQNTIIGPVNEWILIASSGHDAKAQSYSVSSKRQSQWYYILVQPLDNKSS